MNVAVSKRDINYMSHFITSTSINCCDYETRLSKDCYFIKTFCYDRQYTPFFSFFFIILYMKCILPLLLFMYVLKFVLI